MEWKWPATEKKKEGLSLLYPVAGALAAGLIGSAEFGRRLFRDAQLFDPEKEPVKTWDPVDYGFDPALTDEIILQGNGVELYGWYCRARKPRASFLFCHGNSGNLTWFATGIKALADSGFSVFAFDYRGFGRSTGRPTIRGVVRDAVAAAKEHDRLKPADVPSILWGYSLGGAIGAEAFKESRFEGVILQSTFTSLPEITRLHYPGTPLHLLAGNLYDTQSFIRELSVPVLILHGDQDETVPFEMGQLLHKSCEGSIFLMIRGGMHLNLFDVAGSKICRATARFVKAVQERSSLDRAGLSSTPTASPTAS